MGSEEQASIYMLSAEAYTLKIEKCLRLKHTHIAVLRSRSQDSMPIIELIHLKWFYNNLSYRVVGVHVLSSTILQRTLEEPLLKYIQP